jgi:AcrR family transcriptional regulator
MEYSPHDESQPMSLRERKKRLAQATIEEAALRLFQQQGYEQTSIQDIANAVIMSSRTFFRYFATKEEVILGPLNIALSDGMRLLQQVASTESPHTALKATIEYMASLCQQQQANFLIRYQVAKQTPSVASIYIFTLMKVEPVICDTLCSKLESATNRNEVRFLVAIFMTAFRVSLEEWLDNEAEGDLVSLLHQYLERFSSLPQNA